MKITVFFCDNNMYNNIIMNAIFNVISLMLFYNNYKIKPTSLK